MTICESASNSCHPTGGFGPVHPSEMVALANDWEIDRMVLRHGRSGEVFVADVEGGIVVMVSESLTEEEVQGILSGSVSMENVAVEYEELAALSEYIVVR